MTPFLSRTYTQTHIKPLPVTLSSLHVHAFETKYLCPTLHRRHAYLRIQIPTFQWLDLFCNNLITSLLSPLSALWYMSKTVTDFRLKPWSPPDSNLCLTFQDHLQQQKYASKSFNSCSFPQLLSSPLQHICTLENLGTGATSLPAPTPHGSV